MASKKYMIQPVSLPPPSHHRQNGSKTISLLAKNSKSLHALGPSDIKKRDKGETFLSTIPGASLSSSYSSSYSYIDPQLSSQQTPRPNDEKDQPPELETDLKRYRDYLSNEITQASISSTQVFVHPFQYIGSKNNTDNETSNENMETNGNTPTHSGDEDQEKEEARLPSSGDFSSWIKEMNSKLINKKRQIRTEKKRAEIEKQTDVVTPSSPSSSPSLPKKQKAHLFQLRKKKTKKDDYDSITPGHMPRRANTMQPTKQPKDESIKLKKNYSQQFEKSSPNPNVHINITPTTPTSNSNTPTLFGKSNTNTPSGNNSKKSPRNTSQTDLRLFQIVRQRTLSDLDEDASSSSSSTSPRNCASRSPVSAFSVDTSPSPSTPSPSPSPKASTVKSSPFSLNLSFIKTSPRRETRVTEFSSCSSEEKKEKKKGKSPRNVVAAT